MYQDLAIHQDPNENPLLYSNTYIWFCTPTSNSLSVSGDSNKLNLHPLNCILTL